MKCENNTGYYDDTLRTKIPQIGRCERLVLNTDSILETSSAAIMTVSDQTKAFCVVSTRGSVELKFEVTDAETLTTNSNLLFKSSEAKKTCTAIDLSGSTFL